MRKASGAESVGAGPRDLTGTAMPAGRAARFALLLVVPYLVLGFVWVFTNPPGASPDEADHLVKALAAGRLDVGTPSDAPPSVDSPAGRRNASISRVVEIPADLAPDGFTCTAFQRTSAVCLPADDGDEPGTVLRTTTVGAYPVFGYVPMGAAALLTDSPNRAFLAARTVSLLMSAVFLFLAAFQLTRWLGRGGPLGLLVAVTPMAVFAAASVSTSGLEIMSAMAVGAVLVVATRVPGSLRDGGTLAVLAVSASALVLSRQLGVVTLGLMVLVALFRGCAPVAWGMVRRPKPAFLATVVVVVASAAVLALWELRYDHPAETGPVVDQDAWGTFWRDLYGYLHSGIGKFGWLDTPLPGPAVATWVVVASLLVGAAVLLGRRGDRWTVVAALVATVAVTFVTHATVFHPISASVQGRHVLALFALAPLLGGVVVAERLADLRGGGGEELRRLFAIVGLAMAGLQLFSLLVNSRRYAVGLDGRILYFVGEAQWEPRLGWLPWLVVAAVAAAALALTTIRSAPAPAVAHDVEGADRVER